MTANSTSKPPIWFWVVSVVALLWNGMGAKEYLATAYMTEETLNSFPAEVQALYMDIPVWVTAAFAIAVWGGVVGCLALLLRKKWAKPVFLLSFIGIIVQMGHYLLMSKSTEAYGPGGAIMPIMVIVIGIFLIWFSKKSIAQGWIS